ncbi:histidine phosphatase family protein [Roseovarius sp. MS2]|uniref:histidine phosphatase family protein n=1 Tax=Roseovarius sp. MS2 TaxID=3390728 RepID=UPI003EDC3DA1
MTGHSEFGTGFSPRPDSAVYLVRHGRTDWNEKGLIMGQTDIPLNARGIKQVHDALGSLRELQCKSLFSSPLMRSRQTADILANALNLDLVVLDGLKERHWGVFEGKLRTERDVTVAPPCGESFEAFGNRVRLTLATIRSSSERPLIVTHSGVIKVALSWWSESEIGRRIEHLTPIHLDLYSGEGLL